MVEGSDVDIDFGEVSPEIMAEAERRVHRQYPDNPKDRREAIARGVHIMEVAAALAAAAWTANKLRQHHRRA